MDKLIRSFTKNKSSSSNKNKELIISENFEKNIQNWKIPVSSNMKIYRSNGFNFKSDYIIKTIEEAIPLKGGPSIKSSSFLELKRKFSFLRLGGGFIIKVFELALSPLEIPGLDFDKISSILVV